MLINTLGFCASGKVLSHLHFWMATLPSTVFLFVVFCVCLFVCLSTLNISFHRLLACKVSYEKSTDSLLGKGSVCGEFPFFFCFQNSLFAINFWQVDYNVSWWWSLYFQSFWSSLVFIDVGVHFSLHICNFLLLFLLISFLSLYLILLELS